jgi:hypothetical protein
MELNADGEINAGDSDMVRRKLWRPALEKIIVLVGL